MNISLGLEERAPALGVVHLGSDRGADQLELMLHQLVFCAPVGVVLLQYNQCFIPSVL